MTDHTNLKLQFLQGTKKIHNGKVVELHNLRQVIEFWGSDMGTVVTEVEVASAALNLVVLEQCKKCIPKTNTSPPIPVMHSPPRPVTVKDHQDWKIHPCISSWKNKVESIAQGSTDLRASTSYKTITLKWVAEWVCSSLLSTPGSRHYMT